MAVSEDLTNLSTTDSSNTPSGSDAVGADLDDHLRSVKANIRRAAQFTTVATASAAVTMAQGNINQLILVDPSAAARTVSVLTAAAALVGFRVGVKNVSGANHVIVLGSGSDTLDGEAAITLSATHQAVILACTGSTWHVSSDYRPLSTTPLSVAEGGTGAATHTENGVLIGEGTSAFTTVAPGTSGNVLTSDGTDWTSAAASAGAYELVATGSIVSGNVDFTSLSTTYSAYQVIAHNIVPADDNVELHLLVSDDNGSTFKTGATDYTWAITKSGAIDSDGSDSEIALTGDNSGLLGSAAGEESYWVVTVHGPAGSARTAATFEGGFINQLGNPDHASGWGRYNTAVATDAIRLTTSGASGISSGTFKLYGIKAS